MRESVEKHTHGCELVLRPCTAILYLSIRMWLGWPRGRDGTGGIGYSLHIENGNGRNTAVVLEGNKRSFEYFDTNKSGVSS